MVVARDGTLSLQAPQLIHSLTLAGLLDGGSRLTVSNDTTLEWWPTGHAIHQHRGI